MTITDVPPTLLYITYAYGPYIKAVLVCACIRLVVGAIVAVIKEIR